MKCRLPLALLVLLVLTLFPVSAARAQVDFQQLVTFGDSLTDNDLLYLFFPGADPDNYGADPMEAIFDKASQPGDQLVNLAVLGSRSYEVLEQVETYVADRRAGVIPPATFFSFQVGGNDFLDLQNSSANFFLLASAPPGENKLADQLVKGIKKDILTCLQLLQRVDRVPVVFWTIPDVTLTPYALSLGLTSEQASNVRLHLHKLNHFIRARGSRSQTTVLDANQILTSLTFNPPVIFGMPILPTPVFGIPNCQFADPIHPTAVVNAIVANEVIVLLNASFNDSIPLYSEAELADLAGF